MLWKGNSDQLLLFAAADAENAPLLPPIKLFRASPSPMSYTEAGPKALIRSRRVFIRVVSQLIK